MVLRLQIGISLILLLVLASGPASVQGYARKAGTNSLAVTAEETRAGEIETGSLPVELGGFQAQVDQTSEHNEVAKAPAEPEAYRLSPSYPNPFSTRTRFELVVSRSQRVTVEVYNALGQRVATLHEGRLEANKPRAFTWRASSLPSGLYLVRVAGEGFSATRRLVLIR